MPRHLLTICIMLIALCASSQSAQPATDVVDAAKCFAEAPQSVIPYIATNTRLDMLDYFRAGSDRASINDIDGECRVTAETPDMIAFEATDDVEGQLFLLRGTKGQMLIGVIITAPTPIADSQVTIYDSRWNAVPTALAYPTLSQWLTPQGRKQRALVEEQLPFILASAEYLPEQRRLVFTNNQAQYYLPTDTPEALSLLRPTVEYVWDGTSFRPATK